MSKSMLVKAFFLLAVFSASLILPSISNAQPQRNTWKTLSPMPQSISGAKAAVVNGKIYVMGGKANFEYNPDTDTWTTKKSMPTPRMFFEITVYQNEIYTMGGRYSGISFGVNEAYDPSTDTWTTKKSMPTNTSDIEANVVNGKIHLISTNRHDVYDIATDSWTTRKTMDFPNPDYGYSSAVVDSKIYMIGWNQTHIYDPISDSWSLGASPPTSIQDAAAAATTGIMAPKRIYVIGGMSNESIEGTNSNLVYDPETDNWTYGASMPTNRGWLEVVVVEDMIYAIAGRGCAICPEVRLNEQYTPFGYGTSDPSYDGTAPEINLISPENKTYYTTYAGLNFTNIALNFTVDEPVFSVHFALDGGIPVEVSGNGALAELAIGVHNITVFGFDASGNRGTSEAIYFTIEEPAPFPTIPVAVASVAAVAVVIASLLMCFRKRKS